jgi:predicted RNase H-like HicB family nuclease
MEFFWSDEGDAFLVRFRDAPGVMTHGSTIAEAAMQGEDAIIGWITALRDVGLPVPAPKPRSADQRD